MEANTLATICAAIILLLLQELRAARTEKAAMKVAAEAKLAAKLVESHTEEQTSILCGELKNNGGSSVKDKVNKSVDQNEEILNRLDRLEVTVSRFIAHQAAKDLNNSKLLSQEQAIIDRQKN